MMEAEREQLAMLSRSAVERKDGLTGAASRLTGSALKAAAELIRSTNSAPATVAPILVPEPQDDGDSAAAAEVDSHWQAPASAAAPATAMGDLVAEMARREAAARLAGFDEA